MRKSWFAWNLPPWGNTPTRMEPFDGGSPDPWQVFEHWMAEAEKAEPNDPNAAAVATATPDGTPSVRMVLVKGFNERGVRFFTNEDSQKGAELLMNPRAAMVLHWKSLRRQVRFQGDVSLLSRDETDKYFHSRSRKSQIAAAASLQSRPLSSREELDSRVAAMTQELGDKPVPLPERWSGFLLTPRVIELWADGPDRLHNRIRFQRDGDTWTGQRLYP